MNPAATAARNQGWKKGVPYVILSFLFFMLMVPLVLKPEIDIFDARDEKNSHYPTVLKFIEQFPNLDLVDYRSATAPLYHIGLTLSAFVVGSGITQLRFVNLTASLLCLLLVYAYLAARSGKPKGFYFAILFMLSPYFVGPAVRLSTDNAALLLALLSIYVMDVGSRNKKTFLLTNVLIAGAGLTRQVYVWLIGAYLLFNLKRLKSQTAVENVRMLVPVLLPTGVLASLFLLWKGLTPPHFAVYVSTGLNWDAPIYAVSLLGLYGSLFYAWLFKSFENRRRAMVGAVLVSALLAACILLLHPVSNEYPIVDPSAFGGDRGGALWLVASHAPNVLSSSLIFWILFPAGLMWLYSAGRYLVLKQDTLMVICFGLWLMTSVGSTRTYQKYDEPFILFSLGYFVTSFKSKEVWHDWMAPALLLAGFVGVAIIRFF